METDKKNNHHKGSQHGLTVRYKSRLVTRELILAR